MMLSFILIMLSKKSSSFQTLLRVLTGIDLFPPAPGACHADDVLMMFGNGAAPHSPISSGEDAAVVDHVWHAWVTLRDTSIPRRRRRAERTKTLSGRGELKLYLIV